MDSKATNKGLEKQEDRHCCRHLRTPTSVRVYGRVDLVAQVMTMAD